MSRCTVYTEWRDGTDRVYLNAIAPVRGLKYRHGLPGGPLSAQWNLLAGPHFSHRALSTGRAVTILNGPRPVWTGTLTAPQRGDPWQCAAVGDGAQANTFEAYATGGNIYDLGDVLPAAVARGLRWKLPSSLPVGSGDPTGDNSIPTAKIADVVAAVTKQLGKTWWLDAKRNLIIDYPIATANYLFCPSDPGGGRALNDDYVSAYLVIYETNATTGAQASVWVRNSAAETRFDVSEEVLDITDQGAMTAPAATTAGTAQLALHAPRAPFTSEFTLARGQLLTVGGVQVDLASVIPPILGRLVVADPDRASELSLSSPTQILVAETEYDDDADVRTFTPDDSSGSGLVATLATAIVKSAVRRRVHR